MRTRSTVLAFASLSLLASCDPRVFDDLEDQVWVRSDREPADSPSKGFGVGLVSAGGDTLQYFIASKSPPTVFMAKFDQAGERSPLITSEVQSTLTGAESLITSTVMTSDPEGFSGSEGNVAIATFDGTEPALYMLRGENGEATAPINLAGDKSPSGIAFGNTDASAAVDLLATAGQDLNLVADYQAGATVGSCNLGRAAGDVLVADVDPATGGEVLITVGGEVLVTTGSVLATGIADVAQTDCFGPTPPAATITAPGDEASFGALLRQGDFDGDGNTDLVVAAPRENAVYVFFNWTVAAQTEGTKLATPSGAARFGTAMVVGDFNADGTDELVVSDPALDIDVHASAGTVFIFEASSAGDFGEPIELHDISPEDNQDFGQSLAVCEAFGSSRLIVGAKNEVFTYFRTPVAGDDDFRN
jgi:hypothetical protein